jgi:hypothetical protein
VCAFGGEFRRSSSSLAYGSRKQTLASDCFVRDRSARGASKIEMGGSLRVAVYGGERHFAQMIRIAFGTDGFVDPCIPTLGARPPSGPGLGARDQARRRSSDRAAGWHDGSSFTGVDIATNAERRSPTLPRAPKGRPPLNAGMSNLSPAVRCCGRRSSGPPLSRGRGDVSRV